MLNRTTLGLLIYASTVTGCLAGPKEASVSQTPAASSSPFVVSSTESPIAKMPEKVEPSFLVVPNKSFGPITAEFTESDLKKAFGEANVRAEKMYVGDGMEWDGYAVYPDIPDQRLEVFWTQEGPKRLEYLQVQGDSSKWKTAEGVTLGTSLVELEKLNGAPFELTGLDWDFGGMVTDWGGGKLDGLTLQLGSSEDDNLSQEDIDAIVGDRTVASDLPAMRRANPKVRKLTMGFPMVEQSGY